MNKQYMQTESYRNDQLRQACELQEYLVILRVQELVKHTVEANKGKAPGQRFPYSWPRMIMKIACTSQSKNYTYHDRLERKDRHRYRGGRGLGKAVALSLAAEGVNVAITGRNEDRLKATVAEIQKAGVKAAYAVFDAADEKATQEGIQKLAEQLGGVDILINNAGIGDFGTLEEMSAENWKK